MRKYLGLWIVALLVLCAASAWAYPTMDGASGLVTVPTAEVTPTGAVDLAVDYTKIDWWGNDTKLYPVRLNAGVAERLELSASYDSANDEFDEVNSIWTVGAKYAFLTEAKDNIGLALAASWGKIDVDFDDVAVTKVALAVTKTFPVDTNLKLKATAGAVYVNANDDSGWINGDTTRPYVGVELIGEKGANLALEYRWKDSDIENKSTFSAALRLPLTQQENAPLWLQVGTSNGALISLDDQRFFAGLCYRFMSK
jgi:hypothetical protein